MSANQPGGARQSSDGCWKWGAISCGCLILLGVIAVVIMFVIASRNPMIKNLFKTGITAGVCMAQMKNVSQAIDHYKADHHAYPDSLNELVPKYLKNNTLLTCTSEPSGGEFKYYKPALDAPGSTPILSFVVKSPTPQPSHGGQMPAITGYKIEILKDGTAMQAPLESLPAPPGGAAGK